MPIITKICSKCKFPKPFSDFGRDAYKSDGYKFQCKKCVKDFADNKKQQPLVITEIFKERFFSIIEKTETCWLCYDNINHKGYARISYNHKLYSAHRISYEIHYGKIPDNIKVLHHCDIRNCVNPLHLFLGTDKTNSDDKFSKGREGFKLNQQIADDIRKEFSETYNVTAIARKHNVTEKTIYNIVDGKSWNR